MRMIVYFLALMCSTFVFAEDRTLNQKIKHLEELQRTVAKTCINNPKSSKFKLTIDGKTFSCPQLIVITNRLHEQIEAEVKELESCREIPLPQEAGDLTGHALNAAKKAGQCEQKSEDKSCLSEFGCTVMAAANPLGALIGSKLNVSKNACLSKGLSSAQNCMMSVMKGIFDSLWGLVNLIWDAGKAAVRTTAEWLGIIKKHEDMSSDKLLAAQQAGPGFVKRFIANPIDTMKDMASALYNGIRDAAQESYGCEQWSGAPYISNCVKPMTNWNCATCQQKMQVMCGVAGFAIGEIPTAILTGGVAAGGKAVAVGVLKAVKIGQGSGKMSAMAIQAIRAIPKGAEGLEAATKAAQAVAGGAKRVLTAAQQQALKAWKAIEESKVRKAIVEAASKVPESVAADAVKIALKPVSLYLDAIQSATKLGFGTVERALASKTEGAIVIEAGSSAQAAATSRAPASKIVTEEQAANYRKMSGLSSDERATEAERVIGRKLSDQESAAVQRAHEVGSKEGRGFDLGAETTGDVYTQADKYKKGSILLRSSFSRDEAQKLLDAGVAGSVSAATPARAAELAANSKVYADRLVQDLKYTSKTPEEISRMTAEAREAYESAAEGFAQAARSADGKTEDFVKAADAYAKAGKLDKAEKLIGEALKRTGDKASLKHQLQEYLDDIISQGDSNPRNPEFPAQRENLKNLIKRIDETEAAAPFSKRNFSGPVEEVRTDARVMRAHNDNTVKAMGLTSTSGADISKYRKEVHTLYQSTGDAFAHVARNGGKETDYVEAISSYAKAQSSSAKAMMDEALKSGVDRTKLRAALNEKLNDVRTLRGEYPRNPEYGAQEANFNELLARLDKEATAKAPTVAEKPAEVSKPEVTPKPEAPREPASVTPREASAIANEYRLGTKNKAADPTKASEYYYRAGEDNFVKEIKRKKGNEGSKYFADMNINSAFTESLKGDGKVALGMIDKLAKEGKQSALNEFIWEMKDLEIYQQKSPAARANMHKIVDKIQSEYKDLLFTPQASSVKGWKNYNPLPK